MPSLTLWTLHPSCARWAPVSLLRDASSRTGAAAAGLVSTSATVPSSSRLRSLPPTSPCAALTVASLCVAAAPKGGERVETYIKVVRSESYISALHSKSVLQRETDVRWRGTVNSLCQFGSVTSNLSSSHSMQAFIPCCMPSILNMVHQLNMEFIDPCQSGFNPSVYNLYF